MTEPRVQRRLAAILAADVVGYSRLMERDETGTLAALTAHLDELIAPCIAEHRGRVVKTTGDGLLAEFASVVDAVTCAVAFQAGMAGRNMEVPEESRIAFRVGVNLGDVIIQNDDVFGDGVNVAARLEGLAETGEVFVSAVVHDQVEGKIDVAFDDLGEHTVKNMDKPIRVYRVSSQAGPTFVDPPATEVDKLLERPAVAVLAFENIGGDPDQEYFADGLTEDIITALSLWRSFPVIARNSTFAYKGTSPDIRKVGAALGARYVIEGSVRKAGNRIRVTAQLIDAENGHHVWAERFDRDLDDIFTLQDQLTEQIAATVSPELARREQKRSARSQRQDLDAWDYLQRGTFHSYQFNRESSELGRSMFQKALEIDHGYARAFAEIAFSYAVDLTQGFAVSRGEAISGLSNAAEQAVKLDPADAMAQLMMSFAYAWTDQDNRSIAAAERAIELNPSYARAHGHLGNVLDLTGRHDEGIARLQDSLRLNPSEPFMSHIHTTFLARALLTIRCYDDAATTARKATSLRAAYLPGLYILAVSLGHLGKQSEARAALEECEREQPGFVSKRTEWQPYRNHADNEHIRDGLRKAGWEG